MLELEQQQPDSNAVVTWFATTAADQWGNPQKLLLNFRFITVQLIKKIEKVNHVHLHCSFSEVCEKQLNRTHLSACAERCQLSCEVLLTIKIFGVFVGIVTSLLRS